MPGDLRRDPVSIDSPLWFPVTHKKKGYLGGRRDPPPPPYSPLVTSFALKMPLLQDFLYCTLSTLSKSGTFSFAHPTQGLSPIALFLSKGTTSCFFFSPIGGQLFYPLKSRRLDSSFSSARSCFLQGGPPFILQLDFPRHRSGVSSHWGLFPTHPRPPKVLSQVLYIAEHYFLPIHWSGLSQQHLPFRARTPLFAGIARSPLQNPFFQVAGISLSPSH